jgi:Helix-turn-helix domain
MDDAPDVPAHLVMPLAAIARHADLNGRGAYPAASTIARITRKSESQTKRDIAELEKRGLITRGDQRLVLGLRPDKRPIVYDLAMPRDSADDTPSGQRGSAHDTPPGSNGVAPTHERGVIQLQTGVAPTTPEESLKDSEYGGGAPAPQRRADPSVVADAIASMRADLAAKARR